MCSARCRLLDACRAYHAELDGEGQAGFRFLHVSTDEVYGTLTPDAPPFAETNPIAPNSPYAASKAASDHFVRAYHETYGLPTLITNCSNNYGPYQFPEKLIPLIVSNALAGKPLPIYGDGQQVRDWLYVGIRRHPHRAGAGQGGREVRRRQIEMANIEVVRAIALSRVEFARMTPLLRRADRVREGPAGA